MSEQQADLGDFSDKSEAVSSTLNMGKIEISDIGEIVTGNTPSTKEEGNYGGDIPFIRVSDIPEGAYIQNTEKKLSKKGASEVKKRELPENAIMVACIGSIGKTAIVDRTCFTNQQINSVIPNDNHHPWYVYYLLTSKREKFKKYAGGSVQPILSKTKFGNIEVDIHSDYAVQKKIGNTLRKFDEKENLNENINELLEELAQTLYRSWFVDFDPYDEFKDSEIGEIPLEFEVKKIDALGEIVTGNTPSTKNESNYGGKIPFITASDLGETAITYITDKTLTREGAAEIENKKLEKGCVMVSCIGTDLGKTGVTPHTSYTNQQINSIRPKEKYGTWFVYYKMKAIRKKFKNYAGGSAQPILSKSNFSDIKVAVPPENKIREFNEVMSPFMKLIKENKRENVNLSRIRDTLIPKLMSGEIRLEPDTNNETASDD